MAAPLRPTNSYDGEARAFGYHPYTSENDVNMRNQLVQGYSATDPRMTNEERLDQRYGNFQYGPYANYAQDQAWAMQQKGAGAQNTLGGMGQAAWDTGTGIQGRATPQTDFRDANATMSQQSQLYSQLQNYADHGPGPSIAQAQHDANTAQALRQQLMMAQSGRGAGGGAAATRQAAMNQAQIQGQANAQTATLEAQEADLWRQRQLEAYGMGGTILDQQAAQQSQNAQFLTQSELQAQAQRDQAGLAYQQLGGQLYGQGYGTDLAYQQQGQSELENEAQANQAYETNLTNIATGKMAANAQKEDSPGLVDTALGTAAVAAPLIAAFSDERGKKNITGTSLSDTYRAMGGTANDNDYTDAGWFGSGPDAYMRNGAEWKRQREGEKAQREQEERWKKLEAERDAAQAAADKKRTDRGNAIGAALGGLRGIL